MNPAEIADKAIQDCVSSCSKFSQNKERWHLFMLSPLIDASTERIGDDFFLLFFKMYVSLSIFSLFCFAV